MRPLPADLLTVPQAAKLLGISEPQCYVYVTRGTLPAQKLGGMLWVVWRDDVKAFRFPRPGRRPKQIAQ